MKNKLFLLSSLALVGLSANGQALKEGYIKYPESTQLGTYVNNWTPGTPLFEDENFFISRVKSKAYFRNAATQVNPGFNEDNDKKLVFWVPMGSGSVNGITESVIPNGNWNTEMFSMWPYVPHFGNFAMASGWVVGAMADVAHKHGTAVSGNASVPWGAISTDWANALKTVAAADKEKVAKFLLYHGVDGLGYNSEFSTSSDLVKSLRDLHEFLYHYMAEEENGKVRNPQWENIWYDGTNDNGAITFDRGLGSHNALTFGDGENPRASLFFNYNWNNGYLESSAEYAKSLGRSPYDLYAGVNMQGGEPNSNNWVYLQNNPISIGLWGAHDTNMIWAQRNANGSDPAVAQDYYQTLIEQFFTNGNRNPADAIAVKDISRLAPSDDFFGMSAYLSARSTLSWDLATEPFITNFNLGNGTFFNWQGETVGTSSWANIGIQDYMPTWRWWWATKFLGNTTADVPANPLTAKFVWDEAYLGGSSLAIKGSTDEAQYLHLFKTKFALKNADTFTVRFKHMGGSANVTLVTSVEGAESTPIELANFQLLTTGDEWNQDEWVEKTIKITGALTPRFNNKTLAAIALKVDNAKDLDLRLGEVSIVRNSAVTPQAPSITLAKVLYNGPTGIDAKVIFNMANTKAADEPCYNIDVNTSMFKLYAQVEGEPETLISATTSWAGLLYNIPCDPANIGKKVRVGVSAVSLDLKSESAITWSNWLDNVNYTVSDDIQLNKAAIKVGESFEVYYTDANHPTADLKIIANGKTLTGQAGMGQPWVVEGIDAIGQYDLVETYNGNTRTLSCFVPISKDEMGRVPEIYTLTANDKEVGSSIEAPNGELKLGYTGREADGSASAAISTNEKFVGGPMSDLGIDAQQSFTVAAWVKLTYDGGYGSRFFGIEDRLGTWPQSHWGWIWSGFDADGYIDNYTFRTSNDNGSREIKYNWADGYGRIVPGAWTHVALVFEYNGEGGFMSRFYLNGIQQITESVNNGTSTINGPAGYISNDYPVGESMWFTFAGGAGSQPVYNNGTVDDVAIFGKALSEDEVKKVMTGVDEGKNVSSLLAWWSFENDYNTEGNFYYPVAGTKTNARCGRFDLLATGPEGQAQQTYTRPLIEAGSPFLDGDGFEVVTRPTWTIRNAEQTNAQGTGTEGSVEVKLRADRDYTATLTLANSLGKDVRTYPVIAGSGAVETVAADGGVITYTTEEGVLVVFDESDNYTVSVYNLQGMTIAERSAAVEAGQNMAISLGANGVYLVKIARDGHETRTVKVIKK